MTIVCRRGNLVFDRPRVMGILNVTPDSFSDGGRFDTLNAALAHARQMRRDGADIIDIGGESTRPGAAPVSVQQELDRVIPVIETLAQTTDCLLSIDSSKPEVFAAAAAAGADLINDVRALQAPGALAMAASLGLPVCLMHMQGTPETMQQSPRYAQVTAEVTGFLRERLARCVEAGLPASALLVDPGFGFGKTLEHNLQLLRDLPDIARLAPVVTGLSRKRMIGAVLARGSDDRQSLDTLAAGASANRVGDPSSSSQGRSPDSAAPPVPDTQMDAQSHSLMIGSVAAAMLCAQRGASLVRVHDVKPTVEALAVQHAVDSAPRS